MPNWCLNRVQFSHNNSDMIDRLKDALEHDDLFHEFVPCPFEASEDSSRWCRDNWGTKWDIQGGEIDEDNSSEKFVIVSFNTAWCPPITFYRKMGEMGFDINAKNIEECEQIAGIFICEDKCCKYYEYDIDDTEYSEIQNEIYE